MTGAMRVAGLTRHPIKGIGSEALDRITLNAEKPMPGDRVWAVSHDQHPGRDGWRPRRDFLVVASGPSLAAVTAKSDGGRITLTHPDRPDAQFDLPDDEAALLEWVTPLWPKDRPSPQKLHRAPFSTGMPDNGIASLSILTQSSLDALSAKVGQTLDARRFRGNVLLNGTEPWAEFEWIGKRIQIGDAVLDVIEPIERCRATEANPETGERDANTLGALRDGFGHQDFGVYARVVQSGEVAVGDPAVIQ
ncbi:MOSC domain protein [Rhodobacteraceae bacterium THAF1]|uniref:MOSC domain-containing protein n=1 Tax=Palleronia sp. THAF1 TaxID=2587842 RepID=UPI000F3F85F8|nr:MOSC domain-containing protein [Palleronia sp. THAF1]QFU07675.1 MOSC domain protein [Palleronia sp. THAF1]VDC23126.1 MOSC domain protein [Rhodobacteraceae bacterium THAF1]